MARHFSNAALGLGIVGVFAIATPMLAQEIKPRATLDTDAVVSIALSVDGERLATAGLDNSIRLWDLKTAKKTTTLREANAGYRWSVLFSPDGKTLACCDGWQIELWDVEARKPKTLFHSERHLFTRPVLAFSPDGNTLASGGICGREIQLWDLGSGKNTRTLAGLHLFGTRAIAFLADGNTLASVGDYDPEIKLWNLSTGKIMATLMKEEAKLTATFTSDGKALATMEGGRRVKLWDVATGKERAAHREPMGVFPTCVAFSPNGKTLVFGNDKGSIKLYDVATNKVRATLTGHSKGVQLLAFSGDGKMLSSASHDKTVKLWDVE
jgi:WD40 repeat protein